MGTRADFYIGRGELAEWLGSLAFDGYRVDEMQENHAKKTDDNQACWDIKTATTDDEFRVSVQKLLELNNDATMPSDGWPWPWDDSHTTDYAYAFDNGVWTAEFGYEWYPVGQKPEETSNTKECVFPNMKERQKVALGTRSGLFIVQG